MDQSEAVSGFQSMRFKKDLLRVIGGLTRRWQPRACLGFLGLNQLVQEIGH